METRNQENKCGTTAVQEKIGQNKKYLRPGTFQEHDARKKRYFFWRSDRPRADPTTDMPQEHAHSSGGTISIDVTVFMTYIYLDAERFIHAFILRILLSVLRGIYGTGTRG